MRRATSFWPVHDLTAEPVGTDWQAALALDAAVPAGGYRWWYLDALSDDGSQGLTIIFFVGSVFSPYYAAARRRGRADPLAHVAVNVGLYTPRGRRWTMTERGRRDLTRSADRLVVGPSALLIRPGGLELELSEMTAPIPARVRGRIRLHADRLDARWFELGASGHHQWQPVAPHARIDVEFDAPALRWSGTAYVDGNRGSEPLEDGFNAWNWSRATTGDGRTVVFYDYVQRDGAAGRLALLSGADGVLRPVETPPPVIALPRTLWGIPRAIRSERGALTSVARTLEDGPFYARSLVRLRAIGQDFVGVHESLSLDRFRRRGVQLLLPVRMPRRAR